MKIGLIFPHQLMVENPLLVHCETIYLVEEHLFFRQYPFHKCKIAFHRSTMKTYEALLLSSGKDVRYIPATDERCDIRVLIAQLKNEGLSHVMYLDPTDYLLNKRIKTSCSAANIEQTVLQSLLFMSDISELKGAYGTKKRLFQSEFYKQQRINRSILIDHDGSPSGGKWSFDEENRSKFPKGGIVPTIQFPSPTAFDHEAIAYTNENFKGNPGELTLDFIYPSSAEASKKWLNDFFQTRFAGFGTYEDALVQEELILHHSVLTPMMNVGLITPQYVIDEALNYALNNDVPLNSLEGFVRQIIGWREFIRLVYELKGTEERTRNFWEFKRKIPQSFWDGTTGIPPIDTTIHKILKTGYCHHIERLMVLGNFMLLCEFDPDEVYEWFMVFFIDAYDWVMVPNVYGMSQFADGGLMSTKPYISGSNYLMKMGNYAKGPWQATWDGLFWHFMDKQRSFFLSNPRLGMLVHMYDKMPVEKKVAHLSNAEKFLSALDEE